MAEKKESAETTVRRIRRKTRKKYGAEEKIRIVIEGLKGEMTVADLSERRHQSKPILQMVQGISGSRKTTSGREYYTAGRQRRS